MKARRVANHAMTLALGLCITHEGGAAPPLSSSHAAFGDEGVATPGSVAVPTAGSTPAFAAPASSQHPSPPLSAVALRTTPTRSFTRTGCSGDMVRIANRFCIDRYEASMLDDLGSRAISPYYPPVAALLRPIWGEWNSRLSKGEAGALVPLPTIFVWQRDEAYHPVASSRAGVVPQGYVNRPIAEAACASAGKRLCSEEEWTTACRGQRGTKFPYGPTYRQGTCNVFRYEHPGMILHGSFSVDLLDPRLNAVVVEGETLLRPTGATPACKSEWGDDAVYDMVGNLDEYIDDPEGTFLGGFYARSTRNGCDSKITAHRSTYLDYSTGVRCCDHLR